MGFALKKWWSAKERKTGETQQIRVFLRSFEKSMQAPKTTYG
jgi:hypothetical protein